MPFVLISYHFIVQTLAPSELILNPDGSVYHLHLLPHQLARTIITVGDPDRVGAVSRYFDSIEHQIAQREFVTHTGYIGNKRLTVISTGIGTDNIDIVFNELDALVNIDLTTRTIKPQHTQLNIVRIGTSGGLQPYVPLDGFVASTMGMGFDNLLHYYCLSPNHAEADVLPHLPTLANQQRPYLAQASERLLHLIGNDMLQGITATCSGFYAPQGRALRLQPAVPNLLDQLQTWSYQSHQITNFEMETAGIYGMARLLGHHALSTNAIVAQRALGQFSPNPHHTVDRLINTVLSRIVAFDI